MRTGAVFHADPGTPEYAAAETCDRARADADHAREQRKALQRAAADCRAAGETADADRWAAQAEAWREREREAEARFAGAAPDCAEALAAEVEELERLTLWYRGIAEGCRETCRREVEADRQRKARRRERRR